MKVVVGSKNPVKIQATTNAFNKVWPDIKWEFEGVDVPSLVSKQPMSDQESIEGARNRCIALRGKQIFASYYVGIEGGIHQVANDLWFDCGWVVIRDSNEVEGIASSARIETPPQMISLIKQGKELGEVIDIIFQVKNAKQINGHFGLMTNNHVTRESGYTDAIIMALSRFLHSELYSS